jgi:protein kinase A
MSIWRGADRIPGVRLIEKTSKVETRTISSLSHPFIASYFGSVTAKANLYIALECLAGGTLRDLIAARRSIPLETAKIYLAEIALALQFLHKHGIIYRDLKSENVLIGEDGHLKLVDFGFAKAIEQIGISKLFVEQLLRFHLK